MQNTNLRYIKWTKSLLFLFTMQINIFLGLIKSIFLFQKLSLNYLITDKYVYCTSTLNRSQVLCRRLQNKFRADVVGLYENFLLSFVCSKCIDACSRKSSGMFFVYCMCIWKNVLFNLKFHFLFLFFLLAINEMQTFLHILVLFRFNASLLYMQEKPWNYNLWFIEPFYFPFTE